MSIFKINATILDVVDKSFVILTNHPINNPERIRPNNKANILLHIPLILDKSILIVDDDPIGTVSLENKDTIVKNIHKGKIISDNIIINVDVPVLSFKKPPGNVKIPIINNIKNIIKETLLITPPNVNPLKKLSVFVVVDMDGKVIIVITYNRPKTANNMVIINDGPKYCLTYPPGSIV